MENELPWESPPAAGNSTRLHGFLADRWNGRAGLATVFWRDLLIFGTLINLLTLIASLLVLEADGSEWLAMAVFLSPMPWNIFLVLSVFKAADAQRHPNGWLAKALALIWLGMAAII